MFHYCHVDNLMLASNQYLKIIFLFGRPSYNTCIGKILGVFMDGRSRFCGMIMIQMRQMIMSLSKDELWVLKESWHLKYLGISDGKESVILWQEYRVDGVTLRSLVSFTSFHIFTYLLFFCLKSYIWKRLTFRVISTFYGNINT